MSENILNNIISKKIERVDTLKKSISLDSLNEIIDNAYDYIHKQKNWYHNAKLYKKLYSDIKNGK